jgi:hypothetical protein
MERTCTKCGETKDEEEFYWRSPRTQGRRTDCKACANQRNYDWRAKNPERTRETNNRWLRDNPETRRQMRANYYYRLRAAAFDHYGRVCVCCGEDEPKFLALDHVFNDGNIQRQNMDGGLAFLRWLKRENYPDSVQTLCHNCNVGKHLNGGVCPHVVRVREVAAG